MGGDNDLEHPFYDNITDSDNETRPIKKTKHVRINEKDNQYIDIEPNRLEHLGAMGGGGLCGPCFSLCGPCIGCSCWCFCCLGLLFIMILIAKKFIRI
jgi:hypothetical protein